MRFCTVKLQMIWYLCWDTVENVFLIGMSGNDKSVFALQKAGDQCIIDCVWFLRYDFTESEELPHLVGMALLLWVLLLDCSYGFFVSMNSSSTVANPELPARCRWWIPVPAYPASCFWQTGSCGRAEFRREFWHRWRAAEIGCLGTRLLKCGKTKTTPRTVHRSNLRCTPWSRQKK